MFEEVDDGWHILVDEESKAEPCGHEVSVRVGEQHLLVRHDILDRSGPGDGVGRLAPHLALLPVRPRPAPPGQVGRGAQSPPAELEGAEHLQQLHLARLTAQPAAQQDSRTERGPAQPSTW